MTKTIIGTFELTREDINNLMMFAKTMVITNRKGNEVSLEISVDDKDYAKAKEILK